MINAPVDNFPTLPIIAIAADKDESSIDNPAAALRVEATGSPANKYNIPPKAAIATVMITSVEVAFFAKEEATITANIAITAPRATVAESKFFGSIIEREPNDAANKPRATVMIIKVDLQS